MKGERRQELFVVLLIVVSGTVAAAVAARESKNTSDDYYNGNGNNNYNIDVDYVDYHQPKLALFQSGRETHSSGGKEQRQCSETKGVFSVYDYAVVIAMLAVSLKIGVFYGFCHKGSSSDSSAASDFMLGSSMGLFPVTLSLTTSFVTAIELLGNPAEMFFYGSQFALIGKLFIVIGKKHPCEVERDNDDEEISKFLIIFPFQLSR